MSNVLHLNESSFEKEVLNSSDIVLVDFWAAWCGPCKMLSPILDELSNEVKAKVSKVNVDDEPALAAKYGIRSIPTMLIFKNGEKVDQMIGLMTKDKIKEKLEKFI